MLVRGTARWLAAVALGLVFSVSNAQQPAAPSTDQAKPATVKAIEKDGFVIESADGAAHLRLGKGKPPVGLERLQSGVGGTLGDQTGALPSYRSGRQLVFYSQVYL